MNLESPDLANVWNSLNLTPDHFSEKAKWLAEQRRLGSGSEQFFKLAGKLLLHAQKDVALIGPVFFHSVIGLERALRVHYKKEEEDYGSGCEGSTEPFSNLFQRAVDDGVVHDGVFSEIKPLPERFLGSSKGLPETYSGKLAQAVPILRNRYFHGDPFVAKEFFFGAIQLREIADVLKTRGSDQ